MFIGPGPRNMRLIQKSKLNHFQDQKRKRAKIYEQTRLNLQKGINVNSQKIELFPRSEKRKRAKIYERTRLNLQKGINILIHGDLKFRKIKNITMLDVFPRGRTERYKFED